MIELDDVLQATGGSLNGPAHATRFSGFAHDSRQVQPGELFVALRTDWGDGHDYIGEACRGGATGILCERPVDLGAYNVTCIVVRDTLAALADWARLFVGKWGGEVVGVTGSAGKTTTKEAIALVLEGEGPVFKSPGNYSGRLGLPIALGELQAEHRLAVVELACDVPGEMADMLRMARPRHGVVLNVGPAHLETLGSLDDVAGEKGRLVESLPAEGWAVLNGDDPLVGGMAQRTAANVLRFGLGPQSDVRGTDVRYSTTGLTLTVSAWGQTELLSCSLLGTHNAYPVLAAVAVGLIYGVELGEIAQRLRRLEPLPGRLRPLRGREGSLVLDDSYSAVPTALAGALETLAGLPGRPKVAVLGDMAQLGAHEDDAHRLAGRQAARAVDLLVTCGEKMRLAAEEAMREGMARERVRITYTPEDAVRAVAPLLGPEATVLVKGSAESRLEEVVRHLLASPERAGEWLPRQTPGWRAVRLKRPPRPTWVEIDLEAIAHNLRLVRERVGPSVAVMAVLKADGYGHGAIKTARTALNNGATWLGVACLSEALTLRSAGVDAPILVLGYTPPWQARETVAHQVDATVFSLETAEALNRAAKELGQVARVHVKVDTGMGRLGLLPEDVVPFVRALREMPGLSIQGLFTHFAMADSADRSQTELQWRRFSELLADLEARGWRPSLVHAANSAAMLTLPEAHLDMVRIGIALYGLNPSSEVCLPPGFRPALTFKTQVAQVKTLPPGCCVSYGCTYRTSRTSRIAVIPVGYADGFRRAPQHWGEVLVRGRRAPVVGRVCMDQSMIDVTDIPGVRQGDDVVLIGSQGRERITVDEVAARLGTINYEVVSEILARVPRVS